ncbi:MAG: lamin tail domain-containing protein [Marinilabiliales bacterium]|nr:lamin tail domain-containing protein [Marinilabiliales bacterium]
MADPTPVVHLPDREYLELYNAGELAVNLKGWSLGLGTKKKLLPEVVIPAKGYLLVAAVGGGGADLKSFGSVLELSGFGITNTGMALTLANTAGLTVDSLPYDPSMHRKGAEAGGYSLERIDPDRLCGSVGNWATSIAEAGGTPGKVNSVQATNTDRQPPAIVQSVWKEPSGLTIQWSEPILWQGRFTDHLFIRPEGPQIDSVKWDPASELLTLWFLKGSLVNGVDYQGYFQGIRDECGNAAEGLSVPFGIYHPAKGDVRINEVLFHPFPGGSEFIELFNNSGHTIDLNGMWLALRDDNGDLKTKYPVSELSQRMADQSYLVLTKSISGITRFYKTPCEACLLQRDKLPVLSDQAATIVLMADEGTLIDEMHYDEGMHHPAMTETAGISLERAAASDGASKASWHSASADVGYATPGYPNSAELPKERTDQRVTLDPSCFSPNGDGFHDQMKILLKVPEADWILNITILNYAGTVIRKLVQNELAGTRSVWEWDGLNADNQRVIPGIYLLNISLFHPSGKHELFRLSCVVTDRL